MNITIKIEYDNRDQFIDTKGLPKYLLKHIKNGKIDKPHVNLYIENNYPSVDLSKVDPNKLKIVMPSIQ